MRAVDFRSDRWRFFRYVVVGGGSTLVSYGVYVAAVFLGVSYVLASLLSFVSGVVTGFLGQGRYVFGVVSTGALIRYLVYWIFAYLLYLLVVSVMDRLGVSVYVAGAVATVVVAIPSYFFQKKVVFERNKGSAAFLSIR